MGNILLTFWFKVFAEDEDEDDRRRGGREDDELPEVPSARASTGVFLVLRRMRAPLIVLIVIFAVSVLGLTLIPGQDELGRPVRVNFVEAFYFMSFTATTIGFGEIPYPFTPAQRMWVTFVIFLSVIGWAYAVGSLLALMQDRTFRQEVTRRHVARKVARLHEPFLLVVGYGNAAKRLGRSLDDMGRRFVVLDRDETRVTSVDLDSYRADTPAMLGDARDTALLAAAGLAHRQCEGVVALTGDDDANLDVTMTAALLRPELTVVSRTRSRELGERMTAFGSAEVVNPLDRFGDHLRILLRSPAAYQLMMWLTSPPGSALPPRRAPLPAGRWVVCGYGAFGQELTSDLRAEGAEVTVVHGEEVVGPSEEGEPESGPAERISAARLDAGDLSRAAAAVAATESDTTNLWLVQAARRVNADLFVVAMQNRASNAPLFEAAGVDLTVVADEVVVHEVLARLANPLLMHFLPQVPRQEPGWAEDVVARLVDRCGTRAPRLWRVRLDADEAPALQPWLDAGTITLGDVLRSPLGRDRPIDAVALVLLRDGDGPGTVAPAEDTVVRSGDELLVAGGGEAVRALDATLTDPPTTRYVLEGGFVPSGWVLRRLSGRGTGSTEDGDR